MYLHFFIFYYYYDVGVGGGSCGCPAKIFHARCSRFILLTNNRITKHFLSQGSLRIECELVGKLLSAPHRLGPGPEPACSFNRPHITLLPNLTGVYLSYLYRESQNKYPAVPYYPLQSSTIAGHSPSVLAIPSLKLSHIVATPSRPGLLVVPPLGCQQMRIMVREQARAEDGVESLLVFGVLANCHKS